MGTAVDAVPPRIVTVADQRPVFDRETLPALANALVKSDVATAPLSSEPPIIPGQPGAGAMFAIHKQARRIRKMKGEREDYQRLILRSSAMLAEALISLEGGASPEQTRRTAAAIRQHLLAQSKLFRSLMRNGVTVHPLTNQLMIFAGSDDDGR